jgi:hypothetical protein
VYARRVNGKELTFDFAEALYNDNLLIVDRETDSVWSQLHGKSIQGPMKDNPLTMVPSIQSTWKFWRERHPDTRVAIVVGTEGRNYLYRNRKPGTPAPKPRPTTHDTSVLGLGLVLGGKAMFYPLGELERAETPIKVALGGEEATIHYDKEGITAWAVDEEGTLLPAVLAYESGWKDFFPDTGVFRAEE